MRYSEYLQVRRTWDCGIHYREAVLLATQSPDNRAGSQALSVLVSSNLEYGGTMSRGDQVVAILILI